VERQVDLDAGAKALEAMEMGSALGMTMITSFKDKDVPAEKRARTS